MCVLEGPDLVRAALDAGAEFEAIYVDQVANLAVEEIVQRATADGVRVFTLAPGVLEKVADSQTPQPVIGAVRFTALNLDSLSLPLDGVVLVLHEVRDPGNAGTIIRTADALGARAVVLTGHCVDPYNPKTLRSTAGSIFHVPVIVHENLEEVVTWGRGAGARSLATVVRGGRPINEVEFSTASIIVMGNESEGLSELSSTMCDERVTIPMSGRSESLNVSIASALVLYAASSGSRWRQAPPTMTTDE
ncbi:MAG: RNA methyltransferase [Actinomycetota bacterium]